LPPSAHPGKAIRHHRLIAASPNQLNDEETAIKQPFVRSEPTTITYFLEKSRRRLHHFPITALTLRLFVRSCSGRVRAWTIALRPDGPWSGGGPHSQPLRPHAFRHRRLRSTGTYIYCILWTMKPCAGPVGFARLQADGQRRLSPPLGCDECRVRRRRRRRRRRCRRRRRLPEGPVAISPTPVERGRWSRRRRRTWRGWQKRRWGW